MPPGTGLSGAYHQNGVLAVTRLDPSLNFLLYGQSPDPSIASGGSAYDVEWTGYIQPLFSEIYTFYGGSGNAAQYAGGAAASGTAVLKLSGATIFDSTIPFPGGYDGNEVSGTTSAALVAGQLYPVFVQRSDYPRNFVYQLSWSSASQAKQIVPTAQLYPPYAPPTNLTITVSYA